MPHLFKTHGGWQVQQPVPGTFTWRTPTGHTYTKHPDPIGPTIDDDREHARGARTDETTHLDEPDPPPF